MICESLSVRFGQSSNYQLSSLPSPEYENNNDNEQYNSITERLLAFQYYSCQMPVIIIIIIIGTEWAQSPCTEDSIPWRDLSIAYYYCPPVRECVCVRGGDDGRGMPRRMWSFTLCPFLVDALRRLCCSSFVSRRPNRSIPPPPNQPSRRPVILLLSLPSLGIFCHSSRTT